MPRASLLAVYSGASLPQAREAVAHRHMALGAQVVDLIGLHLLDDPDQVGAGGEIAVVQAQPRITLMGILVEVVDPGGVEAAGRAA